MEIFEKIEDILDKININLTISELKSLLKELDRLLDKAYIAYEVEKFTVFLTTIIKDNIEVKEIEYLNMIVSSRKVSVLKPKEKGKCLNRFRIKIINKYSPYLLKSQLFKYELDEVLFLNKSFNDVVYYIDNLNILYNERDIDEQLTKFKKLVKSNYYLKNIDLTSLTIKLYTKLLTKIENLKKDIEFYESNKESLLIDLEIIEIENVSRIREELVNLDYSLFVTHFQNNSYNSLIKLLIKLNPYLIDQYDRRYLVDSINEGLKAEFENLNPIINSVVLKEFTEFVKDYRFTKPQHKYLSDVEINLYKRGFIEVFENKILWKNSKVYLNRICNYLSKNIEVFKGKEYNYLIRSIYKRYNLGEPNKNDLRKNKNDSKGYIEDIKDILY